VYADQITCHACLSVDCANTTADITSTVATTSTGSASDTTATDGGDQQDDYTTLIGNVCCLVFLQFSSLVPFLFY